MGSFLITYCKKKQMYTLPHLRIFSQANKDMARLYFNLPQLYLFKALSKTDEYFVDIEIGYEVHFDQTDHRATWEKLSLNIPHFQHFRFSQRTN